MAFGLLGFALFSMATACSVKRQTSLTNAQLAASVRPEDGAYEISTKGLPQPVLISHVGAEIDHRWVSSSGYPSHQATESTFQDSLGAGHKATVTFTGLAGSPEHTYVLRIYDQLPYGDIEVRVRNTTHEAINVQAVQSLQAVGHPLVNLGGPEEADSVLSDSFSEDRPPGAYL